MILNLFCILKLIESERPDKVFITPSLKLNNILLVKTVSKLKNITLTKLSEDSVNEKRLKIGGLKGKVRLLIERIWYWRIWNLLNHNAIKLNQLGKNKKRNFIFAHYRNHSASLIPLLKQFQDSSDILNIIYVPHKLIQYFQEQSEKNNLKNLHILPFSYKYYGRFRKRYDILRKLLIDISTSDSFMDIEIDSINLSKLIKFSFLASHEQFVQSLQYLENIKQIFEKVKPNILTMLNGVDPIDLLATRLSLRFKIPTLFYPHGITSVFYEYDAFEQQNVICSGQKEKEYFISLGTNEKDIHVLGIPLYDRLYQKFSKLEDLVIIKNKNIKKFNLDPNKKVILFVTTHYENYIRERAFKSVIDSIKNLEECQLIVKLHPMEEISYYEKLSNKFNVNDILILKDVDLHEMIIISDIVIGRSTGAQIEALFLEKNVINLSYEITSDMFLMQKFKAVLTIFDPNELEQVIKKALYDKETSNSLKASRQKYQEYCVYRFDGMASQRIKDLIKKILKLKK